MSDGMFPTVLSCVREACTSSLPVYRLALKPAKCSCWKSGTMMTSLTRRSASLTDFSCEPVYSQDMKRNIEMLVNGFHDQAPV